MGRITRSFTENSASSYKSTWTVDLSLNDIVVSNDTFDLASPTFIARYSGSSKGYASMIMSGKLYIDGIDALGGNVYAGWMREPFKLASGVNYTVPKTTMAWGGRTHITGAKLNTSDFFNSNNPTVLSVPIVFNAIGDGGQGVTSLYLESDNSSSTHWNAYQTYGNINFGQICTLTLDAPPIINTSDVYSDTGIFIKGESVAKINLDYNIRFGGNLVEIRFHIGNQVVTTTDTEQLEITVNETGKFDCWVEVEDSRGQITTKMLNSIFVYEEQPDWIEPFFGRTGQRQEAEIDMTRIATDSAFLGAEVEKTTWLYNDIMDETWNTIVEFCQQYDETITYSSDWRNLNKIESVLYSLNPLGRDKYYRINDTFSSELPLLNVEFTVGDRERLVECHNIIITEDEGELCLIANYGLEDTLYLGAPDYGIFEEYLRNIIFKGGEDTLAFLGWLIENAEEYIPTLNGTIWKFNQHLDTSEEKYIFFEGTLSSVEEDFTNVSIKDYNNSASFLNNGAGTIPYINGEWHSGQADYVKVNNLWNEDAEEWLNANAVRQDATGEWHMNDEVEVFDYAIFNIDFTCNGSLFDALIFSKGIISGRDPVWGDEERLYYDGWESSNVLNITGGDLTNPTLLEWLNANGTKQ